MVLNEISIQNKHTKKKIRNSNKVISSYGEQVSRKYIERINIIKKSNNIDELIAMRTLRCHPLKGADKGKWSIKLTGFMRLIFTLQGEKLEIVKIEEVSKHYDD
ncbi:MAG: type II toxin-antitoxin system RelE/ParE family toxin [Melioribacteraceae bacterium]|nr:type II toxin-antitoxin system RelE/ParE family toxin [Melioribacteraceae bacterium]MCF8356544.1 type II toxin-antitoxin system RelE/ParE family toxin [Melioribacteraceae bacterium]MCF8395937.1 type II toxin-antitoxin system RelE/ParE family toxin [Melioribacteraceae bacterium]MCF8421016.1 type II toxin-antitoxin system RelE/ParE family toxin [Melioribacteraceae bacterium]